MESEEGVELRGEACEPRFAVVMMALFICILAISKTFVCMRGVVLTVANVGISRKRTSLRPVLCCVVLAKSSIITIVRYS